MDSAPSEVLTAPYYPLVHKQECQHESKCAGYLLTLENFRKELRLTLANPHIDPESLTLEENYNDYSTGPGHWLQRFLDQVAGLRNITHITCLGLGSIKGRYEERHGCIDDSSIMQLALLVEIQAAIACGVRYKETGVVKIPPIYFQDPLFDEEDFGFLGSLPGAVVLPMEQKPPVTTETFLYAPHLIFEVLVPILWYSPAAIFSKNIASKGG